MRKILIVGAGQSGLQLALSLQAEGYDVTPVNPRAREVLGRRSYSALLEVPDPIDVVDIFREPAVVPEIVEQAIARQAKVIWMQLGVIHEEAALRAREAGLEVVMDRCMKIEHARFFGGLNAVGLNTGVISALRRPRGYR